jgi:AraC family transcriptional regulator of adaptative response/methylated-DNA-[protein]-cysteine methyltransferase
MTEQQNINYNRIAEAIEYIKLNFKHQPHLDDVANNANLSPFHFQKLFSEWVGTSPKKFLQYTTTEYAKTLLVENKATLFDTAYHAGLSGTGRLHDLFVNIEGMTPAEYKNGGKGLVINYSFADSPFGNMLVASTKQGICYMAFVDDHSITLSAMHNHFPNAHFNQGTDSIQQNALSIFSYDWTKLNQIKLHLKGTAFQLKVWQALIKIPLGQLTTYGTIAHNIGNPGACRAVGSAIGTNPIAFLIPCHRVIQSSGALGEYMWGNTRKTAIIGWEGTKRNT